MLYMKIVSNLKDKYSNYYINIKNSKLYPSEYLVRIFQSERLKKKFNFPNFSKKKLLDMSCGDGRNLPLFYNLNFKIYATEITKKIIEKTKRNIKTNKVIFKVGNNQSIPFKNNFFDFIVCSHSCYYVDKNGTLEKNLKEIKRVMKKDSFLIGTMPHKNNYYFKKSMEIFKNHYRVNNDYLNLRNNYVLSAFSNKNDLIKNLKKNFKVIGIGTLNNNYFEMKEKMFIFVVKK
tara:strand:+ start:21 stop:716 length:696 start_codon:yes stop_codon:yes gene_type:complete